MNINLDEMIAKAEAQVLPWDLTITLGGRTYATRPITVAELGALKEIGGRSEAEQRKLVASLLITGGTPERTRLADLSIDQVGAIAVAVLAYFGGRVKKKSLAVANDVLAAMGMPRVAEGKAAGGSMSSS